MLLMAESYSPSFMHEMYQKLSAVDWITFVSTSRYMEITSIATEICNIIITTSQDGIYTPSKGALRSCILYIATSGYWKDYPRREHILHMYLPEITLEVEQRLNILL